MSTNFQSDFYYEIGIFKNNSIINEYVTDVPIVENGCVIQPFVDFIKSLHDDNILILFNKKTGKLPDNKQVIDIDISSEKNLKYNK